MKKPKRNDIKYMAIEGFRDFEFVECIAFEMAIRNKKNFEALKSVIKYKYSNFKYSFIDIHIDNIENDEVSYTFKEDLIKKLNLKNIEDANKIISNAKNLKLLQDNGVYMDNIYEFYYSETEQKCLEYFIATQHFTQDSNKNTYPLISNNVKKYILFKKNNDFYHYNNLDKLYLDKQHDKLFTDGDMTLKEYGFTRTTTTPLNIGNNIPIYHLSQHIRTEIHFEYQRPKLRFKANLNTLVNLNLALPIAELEQQVKMLKKKLNYLNLHSDIDNYTNRALSEDNEYFFNTENYLKKHNRNKVYADLFFTYDYYNYMYPTIKRFNKIKQVEENKKIQKIRNRKDLDSYDKQNMIDELKSDRKKLTRQDILIEIERQIELFPKIHELKRKLYYKEITEEDYQSKKEEIELKYYSDKKRASKAEKDLKYMQDMIDKLKYKDFITGIKYSPKNT